MVQNCALLLALVILGCFPNRCNGWAVGNGGVAVRREMGIVGGERMGGLLRVARTGQGESNGSDVIRVGIMGASGYTGAELMRLLLSHGNVKICILTGNSQAGKDFASVFPQFSYMAGEGRELLPRLTKHENHDWGKEVDIAFCCLPHGTTQEIMKNMPKSVRVVDLSADFRLRNIETYKEWYGGDHKAPELQSEFVYGLTELARSDVKNARLVANPGCYPTAAQLPLIPLLTGGIIDPNDIIIDAKSGTSGAGRSPSQGTLYCEISDGIKAYGVASHRHTPEIEQGLSDAAGQDVVVNFTPHLMPMNRGILATIYVKLAPGLHVEDAKNVLQETYDSERFVTVMKGKDLPQTRHVRGSNHVFVNIFPDRVRGRAIIVSVIDNLVKGASGQAVQNMNVMFGLPEHTGIDHSPLFP